jgi:hypothetical protein
MAPIHSHSIIDLISSHRDHQSTCTTEIDPVAVIREQLLSGTYRENSHANHASHPYRTKRFVVRLSASRV